jgi:membrane protein YqaA with SNARE-associated domain
VTTWLLVALGVALASSIVPVISVELFLLTLVTTGPHIPFLWLGLVIAIGQMLGKLLYFYAARGAFHLPQFMRTRLELHRQRATQRGHPRWVAFKAWWARWLGALRERCHKHPHWMVGTHAVSSVFGIPPFMATTILAGLAGMSLGMFLTAGLSGRIVRFSVLAASPALFAGWLA